MSYIRSRIKTTKMVNEKVKAILKDRITLKEVIQFIDVVQIDYMKSIKLLDCLLFDDNLALLGMLVEEKILSPRESSLSLTVKELELIKEAIFHETQHKDSLTILEKINSALNKFSPLERLL